MDIQQSQTGGRGMFYIAGSENNLAELDYSIAGTIMTIQHTEVADSLKGKNIGTALVNAAVEFARKNQFKILPLCPFANALMKRHKADYADVLKEN